MLSTTSSPTISRRRDNRSPTQILTDFLHRPGKLDEAEVQAVMRNLERRLGPYPWTESDQTHFTGIKLTEAEVIRRRLGARRLKERLSPIPWYREQAKKFKDEEKYWLALYGSCVKA